MGRILILDSQTALRHQLLQLLEHQGHQAIAVATVSQAASFLEEHVPDLLATNVALPNGSGISLAERAKAAGAKVLMITGSPDRIIEFGEAGQQYLSKPFPPEVFLRRVEEILS